VSEHFRKLEHMYHGAAANQRFDPELTVEEGRARVAMDVDPAMHHAAGAAHGHWLFKLLDDAAFFSANSLVEATFVLTVNFDVHLLAPVAEGRLVAEAEVVHEGGSSLLAEAVVRSGDEQVARGTGSFVKGKRPLADVDGYALPDEHQA
jgi:uncharacterized protein (TIGR00369 family)